jgi:hypothetical protein
MTVTGRGEAKAPIKSAVSERPIASSNASVISWMRGPQGPDAPRREHAAHQTTEAGVIGWVLAEHVRLQADIRRVVQVHHACLSERFLRVARLLGKTLVT